MSLMRLPSWAYTLAAILPAFLAMAIPPPDDVAVRLAITIPILVWVIALGCIAWIRLDEAGREAHKFAWFWGGACGLLLAQFIAITVFLTPLLAGPVLSFAERYAQDGRITETAFGLGVLCAALIQVAGYGLVWAGWWLSRRMGK